ncbi:MAG: 4-hydroxythreonine-4-phosphate dehydrogenase [Geminicoccaceae bacterium]|nr:MAG: 4-hydroxythreonine-4-phosphate dehydrogenase [Geminicoccaceae bacterium]
MTTRLAWIMGDPAGIGAELMASLLAAPTLPGDAKVLIIGDRRVLAAGEAVIGVELDLPVVHELDTALASNAPVVLLDMGNLDPATIAHGEVSAAGGAAVLANLRLAMRLAREGKVDAVTFTPFNKQALKLGGNPFNDELEFMLHELGLDEVVGEFNVSDRLWNARVTSHVPLRDVAGLLSVERIVARLQLTVRTMQAAGIEHPRIAVAALNPHAGEGGAFGHEDDDIIAPAVAEAQALGLDVSGPFPSDTVFLRARDGHYDAVLTMYHDQGQIAIKLLGFEHGVTVLAGLPVPITTPAHGTAYDIAGSGRANPEPTRRAFAMACALAAAQRAH